MFNIVLPAQAGGTFTINVYAANVRSGPGLENAVLTGAYFAEQFAVLGVSADEEWVRIERGWVFAALGTLDESALPSAVATAQAAPVATRLVPTNAPVVAARIAPAQATAVSPVPPPAVSVSGLPGLPALTASQFDIYRRGVAAGRNPLMFTHAGDSNTENLQYRERVATGWHGLNRFPQLGRLTQRWAAGIDRPWLAVRGGYGAWSLLLPDANVPVCAAGESLFACDLRVSNASVVFIQIGTGDKFAWRSFEGNLRRMTNEALARGVLPVLVSKADNLESQPGQGGASDNHINGVIRRVAAEQGLPLIDFWQATQGMPTIPNPNLPDRPFTQSGLLDEWGYYFHLSDEAKSMRVLMTLLTLEQLAR